MDVSLGLDMPVLRENIVVISKTRCFCLRNCLKKEKTGEI
jgi:hypothetical protein